MVIFSILCEEKKHKLNAQKKISENFGKILYKLNTKMFKQQHTKF